MGIKSYISTIFNGTNQAFIYIWLSKSEKFVYVGQTNERLGTLGRGHSHLQPNGTLRLRCSSRVGLELEKIPDLYLFSFPLPQTNEFISTESSFRLAVEYLVQSGLHEAKKNLNPKFQVISNITTTAMTRNSKVLEIASSIIEDFKNQYEALES